MSPVRYLLVEHYGITYASRGGRLTSMKIFVAFFFPLIGHRSTKLNKFVIYYISYMKCNFLPQSLNGNKQTQTWQEILIASIKTHPRSHTSGAENPFQEFNIQKHPVHLHSFDRIPQSLSVCIPCWVHFWIPTATMHRLFQRSTTRALCVHCRCSIPTHPTHCSHKSLGSQSFARLRPWLCRQRLSELLFT